MKKPTEKDFMTNGVFDHGAIIKYIGALKAYIAYLETERIIEKM